MSLLGDVGSDAVPLPASMVCAALSLMSDVSLSRPRRIPLAEAGDAAPVVLALLTPAFARCPTAMTLRAVVGTGTGGGRSGHRKQPTGSSDNDRVRNEDMDEDTEEDTPALKTSLSELSFFLANGTAGLPSLSPVLSELPPRPSSTPTKHQGYSGKLSQPGGTARQWEAPARDGKRGVVDMPVTFLSRIRSSGYGQSAGPGAGRKGRTGAGSAPRRSPAPRMPSYPVAPEGEVTAMSEWQTQNRIPKSASSAPVLCLAVSPEGRQVALAVGGADHSSLPCLRLPFAKYGGEGRV